MFDNIGEIAEGVEDVVFEVAVRVGRRGRPFGIDVGGGADDVAGCKNALQGVVGVTGIECADRRGTCEA